MAYRYGQWAFVCDRCGFEFLSGEAKKTWDGFMVDAACWEPRHPSEFFRARREFPIPWQSPEQPELSVSPFEYVDNGYWDGPSVVPPAVLVTDEYTTNG